MQMMDTRSETGAHNNQTQEYGGANVDPRSMQQKADERQQQDHTAYQQPQTQQQDNMPDYLPGIDADEDEIPFAQLGLQYPRSLYVM